MRLNLFKYNVQDRNYSRAEIVHLLNDKSYIHMTLSDSQIFYSLGTGFEGIKKIATPITYVASSLLSFSYNVGKSIFYSKLLGIADIDSPVVINNKYNYDSNFKLTDIDDYKYSGREVTKFLNEYYDYGIHWNSEVYYGKIIDKFLSHDYVNADVPTIGDSGLFDIAVLDAY